MERGRRLHLGQDLGSDEFYSRCNILMTCRVFIVHTIWDLRAVQRSWFRSRGIVQASMQ